MSLNALFQPIKCGPMVIKNRFIRSATCESMANPKTGIPTNDLFLLIKSLADGGCGLIIPGYVYIDRKAKGMSRQTGFETDQQAYAWKDTIKYIHSKGSKIVFQLAHCGGNSISGPKKNPTGHWPFSSSLSIPEIHDIIEKFRRAAVRAEKVGADGVQLHAAHSYLLARFLSPYSNHRKDQYGGSLSNRMRIIQEIVDSIRASTSSSFSVGIKINGHDCCFPAEKGITPSLAAEFVHKVKGIDYFEISCGLQGAAVIRNDTSKKYKLTAGFLPRTIIKAANYISRAYPYSEGYNMPYAEHIKKVNPDKIIASVGGWRNVGDMKKAIESGKIDMISMSRPFIRDPDVVNQIMSGRIKNIKCVSCNQCLFGNAIKNQSIHCFYPKIQKD